MECSVKEKHTIIKVAANLSKTTLASVARNLGVSKALVHHVAVGWEKNPRVKAAIVQALGLPEDFFSADYEMTITLKKKEVLAA